MTSALLAAGALIVAAAATRGLLTRLIPTAPLTRKNYRGIAVPTGLGVAPLFGLLAGAALIAVVHAVAPAEHTPRFANLASLPGLMLALGFGLLGLFDDLTSAAAPDATRGFKGHFQALREGRVTGGGVKMLGGIALALVAGSLLATSVGWAIANAAVIALAANLHNSLDVRPGRSLKTFLIAAVPMTVFGGALRPLMAASVGAAASFLREDLRERAMLGDAGSNALGALVGYGVVVLAPGWLVLSALGLLVVLTIVAEGPTLSAGIAKLPPLRAFDELGRVSEVPEAVSEQP